MVRPKTKEFTVKRTLRSGADGDAVVSGSGCGPQPYEPPLKRQTRQDAKKHASGSSKTDSDSTQESSKSQSDEQLSGSTKRKIRSQNLTPASNKTDTEASDENSSAQVALRNDIVLESLLRYMNPNDLLTCRRVSKQWEYAGAKELQRRKLIIRLSFESPKYGKRGKNVLNKMCWLMSKCQTPLFLLSSFQIQTTTRDSLGSGGIINIFNAVGNHIKNLTLFVDYTGKKVSLQHSSLLAHLEHLLISQVPNLEFLELNLKVPFQWEDDQQQLLDSSIYDQNDNNGNGLGSSLLLPKLKTFIVTGSPPLPLKFFGNIVNAAVNLNYLGGVFSHYFSALVKYVIAPPDDGRDKILLLKDLRFQLHDKNRAEWNAADFEIMETFLTNYKTNLKLEKLEILYKKSDCGHSTAIQNVISQVLEYSSETLTKLMIRPLRCFPVLAIPFLPELQEIVFHCGKRLDGRRENNYSCHFFPTGLNMRHSFPFVSSLVFLNCSIYALRKYILGLGIQQPKESVRYIHVKVVAMYMCDLVPVRVCGRPSSSPPTPLPPLPTEFHLLFPNLVSITYDNTALTIY